MKISWIKLQFLDVKVRILGIKVENLDVSYKNSLFKQHTVNENEIGYLFILFLTKSIL